VIQRDPSASPVLPTIPETSPVDPEPVLMQAFPGTGSTRAMVLRTETVDSKKGLTNSAFKFIVLPFSPMLGF
jgi:hypothetical protein